MDPWSDWETDRTESGLRVDASDRSRLESESSTALEGLFRLEARDHALFQEFMDNANVRSYLYYFPLLYYYGAQRSHFILWERVADSILLYQLRRRRSGVKLNLFLPPFPFDPSALRHAIHRMREFNAGRSGRIIWVQEEDALAVARLGLEIHFKADEYLLDRARVMAHEGGEFRSLRQELTRARNLGVVETRPYVAGDRAACMDLLEAWRERLLANDFRVEGYPEHVSTLEDADIFPSGLLRRLVVEVDGEVRGFALSGAITKKMGSNYICVTDTNFRGLPHFLRYQIMNEFPELPYFNDSVDMGRPGLRELKLRFRPVEMHGLFGASEP